MNKSNARSIEDLARQALERDIEQLGSDTLAQLRASRMSALTALQPKRRVETIVGWAMAASVLLAFNVWWWQAPVATDLSAEDFAMIVSEEYIELNEDLDFYNWVRVNTDAS